MNVRRARRRLGLTQQEAAEAASIDVRHFQKLERGEVGATLKTLDRLSRALLVPAPELIT